MAPASCDWWGSTVQQRTPKETQQMFPQQRCSVPPKLSSRKLGRGTNWKCSSKPARKLIPPPKHSPSLMMTRRTTTRRRSDLSQLIITQNYKKVCIDIKVVKKSNATYVAGNKRKQDVIIADNTGRAKVTLWEQNVDALTPDSSYSLQNFVVREYKGRKFLSMPREGAEIIPIPDVGPIDSESNSDSEWEVLEMFNVQITRVPQLDSYKACLSCKARVEPSSPPLGRCSKCTMLQRFDICPEQMSAKLMVMSLARPCQTAACIRQDRSRLG